MAWETPPFAPRRPAESSLCISILDGVKKCLGVLLDFSITRAEVVPAAVFQRAARRGHSESQRLFP